jgi:tetratricopeptide (TPR) repeat protein
LLRAGKAEEALRLLPANHRSVPVRIGRIQALLESGKAPAAREECQRALRDGIGTAPLLAACGQAQVLAGDWAQAYDLFEGALLRSPENSGLARLKFQTAGKASSILLEKAAEALGEGEFAEAQAAADRAVLLNPADVRALELSGRVALAREDLESALRRLFAAWKLDPRDLNLGERAGDLAIRTGHFEAGYEIFSSLARQSPRFRARAEECQEEFVVSNWPSSDRETARAARLTRAQAALLIWRLLPQTRGAAASEETPIASDILARKDQKILAHSIQIGLIGVDASTHRARPDAFLPRSEAVRMLLRAASVAGLPAQPACVEKKVEEQGLLGAAASCGLLAPGKMSSVSGSEFRRALAALQIRPRPDPR